MLLSIVKDLFADRSNCIRHSSHSCGHTLTDIISKFRHQVACDRTHRTPEIAVRHFTLSITKPKHYFLNMRKKWNWSLKHNLFRSIYVNVFLTVKVLCWVNAKNGEWSPFYKNRRIITYTHDSNMYFCKTWFANMNTYELFCIYLFVDHYISNYLIKN